MNIYNLFKQLNIQYEELKHNPIFTIEDALKENIVNKIEGLECKNLFVKNKHNYYLIIIPANKKANLKELAKTINETRFSFASTKELNDILKIDSGSVTPLSIINDQDNLVTLLISNELINHKLLLHPNINNKTVSIYYDDLIKIINYCKHNYIVI